MTFEELGLSDPLIKAVKVAGYDTPTEIQIEAIPRILAGMDILAAVKKTHIPTPQTEQPIEGVQKDKIISAEVIRKRDHEYKPDKIKTETSAEGK